MDGYTVVKNIKKDLEFPRLPLEANFEITYRCNNNCRHCWLRLPPNSEERRDEVELDDIKRIVDEAREMGCRRWHISGGEPMIRPDFLEIFDYITTRSSTYILNSNGTLITQKIAKALKKPGVKMISIYGATAEVNDHITRNPGSFEAVIRGLNYLKEAGVDFIVQITPMRGNYHQIDEMLQLAKSFSDHWRIGADWFYLSAWDNPDQRNQIICQRLSPEEVLDLSSPDISYLDWNKEEGIQKYHRSEGDNRLFAACVESRRRFQLDPYGNLTFCNYFKEPEFLYDLKKGSFREGWDEFIPSLMEKYEFNDEYKENCGSCELKSDCHWCPAFAYLENRSYTAKVEYLCDIAREYRKFRDDWIAQHRRYYNIAGITIQVESSLPVKEDTFLPRIKKFQVEEPGEDIIKIKHFFQLPNMAPIKNSEVIFKTAPWTIYKKDDSWIYVCSSFEPENEEIYQVAVFSKDHSRAQIFNRNSDRFLEGDMSSVSFYTNDQILLARVLPDREGYSIHASGVILDGKGLVFAGEPKSGKTTLTKMLANQAEILCDERVILRRWPQGFRVHGTWNHSFLTDVSPNSAPLNAIIFLEKSQDNRLVPIDDKKEILKRLLSCVVKPFVTADWWEKTLTIIDKIANQVPCYKLEFDLSGKAVELLKDL